MMNWKGCGRKRSWFNLMHYLIIYLKRLKIRTASLRIAGFSGEIRIWDIPKETDMKIIISDVQGLNSGLTFPSPSYEY
jgi:hypothetical protein